MFVFSDLVLSHTHPAVVFDTGQRTAYWTTTSQVAVVLALALVVEARAVMGRWTRTDPPTLVKSIQGITWTSSLLMLVVTIEHAVEYMRFPGREDPFWPGLGSAAISSAVGSLIVNVALELAYRANARPVAWLSVNTRTLRLRLRMKRLDSETRSLTSDIESTEARVAELAALAREVLADPSAEPEDREAMEQIVSLLNDQQERLADQRERLRAVRDERQDMVNSLDKYARAEIERRTALAQHYDLADGDAEAEVGGGEPAE